MSDAPPRPLQFLMPGWFAVVMGLCGLSLAWHRAEPVAGAVAHAASLALGILAAVVFTMLAVLSLLRGLRHRQAVIEDMRHPVRHAFWAAIPVSGLLIATAWLAHAGARPGAHVLWWISSVAQLAVTVAVTARWWRGNQPGGLVWTGITPALFIPIVGNVLVPLAGVPLGHAQWSAAQFGAGAVFWPVVLVLIMVRKATAGLWPERLLPTAFIHVAPPAVGGLALLQLGAPALVAWSAWGMALVFLLWASTQWKRIAALPFGIPHWAMSFPLAAFTAFTWRLADPALGGGTAMLAIAAAGLAGTSLLVVLLLAATMRGLLRGSLLVAEPLAPAIGH